MEKILLDENVPIRIKKELERHGYKDVKHINDINKGLPDDEVYNIAIKEKRMIISGDNHFKKTSYKYNCGIIYISFNAMRQEDIVTKIDWVNNNLVRYNINIEKALIYISETEYYIRYMREKNKKEKEKKIQFAKIRFDKKKNKKERTFYFLVESSFFFIFQCYLSFLLNLIILAI